MAGRIEAVADASALLAYIFNEPGGVLLAPLIGTLETSSVNLCEVVGRLERAGFPPDEVRTVVEGMQLQVTAFSESQAWAAAALARVDVPSRRQLALGDRACIALAAERGLPALTADRIWAEMDLPAEVVLIR